jgi:hypothetical protein
MKLASVYNDLHLKVLKNANAGCNSCCHFVVSRVKHMNKSDSPFQYTPMEGKYIKLFLLIQILFIHKAPIGYLIHKTAVFLPK